MWQDYEISAEDMENLQGLIPGHLVQPLKDGTLKGVMIINTDSGADPLVGVVLYSVTRGYVQIEWVETTKDYGLYDHGADMVRILVNRARLNGNFKGVFATFKEEERMSRYFPEYEFIRREEEDRIYRFSLKDVKKIENEDQKLKLKNCIPLKKVSEELKDGIFEKAEKEGYILPLSRSDDWNIYEPDASSIYENDGTGEAEGMILISLDEEELVVSLLYGANPLAAMALIKHALSTVISKYGDDMEVACPVLSKESERLIKDLVKDARCEKHIRAEAVFK